MCCKPCFFLLLDTAASQTLKKNLFQVFLVFSAICCIYDRVQELEASVTNHPNPGISHSITNI